MHDMVTKCKVLVHYNHFEASTRKAAAAHGVGKATVARWVAKDRSGVADNVMKKPSLPQRIAPLVSQIVLTSPYSTVCEVKQSLNALYGVLVSLSTVTRALRVAKLTYKLSQRDSGNDARYNPHPFFDMDACNNAISVDETCFYLSDTQRRGWCPKGGRLRKCKMVSRIKVSMLLAIDREGVVAHSTIRGNFNTELFAEFVARLPCGRPIVLDNVAFHKAKKVRAVAAERDCDLRFTPPYCPWFNPTEHAFSVCKARFRHNAVNTCHTVGNLGAMAEDALATVTAAKCQAFFSAAQQRVMRARELLQMQP